MTDDDRVERGAREGLAWITGRGTIVTIGRSGEQVTSSIERLA